jgi:hypothetical protein
MKRSYFWLKTQTSALRCITILFAFIFPLSTNPVFAQAKIDARTEIIQDEINKKKKEVEAFDPTTNSKFVERGFKDWVLFSVSKRARREYYEQDKFTPAQQDVLDPEFDSLGEAVSGKLALYKPSPRYFAFRSPADETLMTGQLRPSSTRKILKTGLGQANWEIYKDSIGLPSYRFKRGYILAKDSADDHPFCKLYYISVVQDYAGGGRYAASNAKYEETNLIGCP